MTEQILTEENIKEQIRYVSHEIRNHLSICDMYSQIIKRTLEKSGITNETLDNSIACIQQSVKIIGGNLLELKSINSGAKRLYDFKTLLIKGVEMAKAYSCDNNIEFEVFVKNTANIEVDENRFLACLINIIKNGIEAIEVQGKISLFAEIKENNGIIRISNNGKIIPKDKQTAIFECGYTTKKNGTGLGLAICKKYLAEQNATLELKKSVKGQTTFEIIIKLP